MAEIKVIQCKQCKSLTRVPSDRNALCVWCKEDVAYAQGMMTYADSGRCEKCGKDVIGICKGCKPGEPTYVNVDPRARQLLVGPYITWDQFNKDIVDFSDSLKGKGYDAVIGVPRSGLVVASQMSIRMGLPLYSIGEYGPIYLGGGLRVRKRKPSSNPEKALLVEDSSASGSSIREAIKWMDDAFSEWGTKTAAIYCTEKQLPHIDETYRTLELPHWFEWNLIWNQVVMQGLKVGVDFDGILCPDFAPDEDDDGWKYLEKMKNIRCLVPQGTHVYAIITARMEKYRPFTEDWLRKHGITYQHLIMGKWESNEERQQHCMGTYKAEHCDKLGVGMYIESCPRQAKVIKSLRSHAVLCPALGGSIAK